MSTPTLGREARETIVLIHGLWMTPLSWERWFERYSERGHRVHVPAWPGMEGSLDDLRRDTSRFARVGVTEIADHYEAIIRGLDQPPIIMGHSFGGLVTQLLLDRGLGAAGVAVHAAPIRGVLGIAPSSLRVASAALRNPANNYRAVALSARQFRYAFTNTLEEDDAAAVYERYAAPGPGRPLFQAAMANLNPRAATRVNVRNDERPPLLLLGGGLDHTVPAATSRASFRLYRRSQAVTEYKEYPQRSHYTVGEDGWEDVADHALRWAMEQAAARAPA
jgi:pimeloyl-ACP methyl ester carboxylesterase